MDDFMLDEQARTIRDQARAFVRSEVDPEYLRRMDRDEVRYPRALYESYARHRLLGLRFPPRYGGQGMSWVAECAVMEEIGCLGMAAGCAFVMQIWTGTNEIMSAMVQHDLYQEWRAERGGYRDVEKDAMHDDASEKIFDDDDMWRLYEKEA